MNTLLVPKKHEAPGEGSIEISWEWLGDGPGEPVLFLCGGPGERATELAKHMPWSRLAESRPILLLNQRGASLEPPALDLHPRLFADEEVALALLAEQLAPFSELIGVLTPWQSAQDIPLLLQHLGLESVDVIAHSYGTHLTMALMKASPGSLRRVVMLGFEGPDQTFKHPEPFLQALRREGVSEGVDELLSGPELEWSGGQVGPFGLRWMLSSWLGLASGVRRLHRFLEDPVAGIEPAAAGFHRMLSRRGPCFTFCDAASGSQVPRGEGEWARAVVFPVPQLASRLGLPVLPDWFRRDPVWPGPALVLTGEHDCFTPPSNFAAAGAGLTGARHEVVREAFHDTLLLDATISARVCDFLLD